MDVSRKLKRTINRSSHPWITSQGKERILEFRAKWEMVKGSSGYRKGLRDYVSIRYKRMSGEGDLTGGLKVACQVLRRLLEALERKGSRMGL